MNLWAGITEVTPQNAKGELVCGALPLVMSRMRWELTQEFPGASQGIEHRGCGGTHASMVSDPRHKQVYISQLGNSWE